MKEYGPVHCDCTEATESMEEREDIMLFMDFTMSLSTACPRRNLWLSLNVVEDWMLGEKVVVVVVGGGRV